MGDSEQCDKSIKDQSSLSKIMEVFNDDPYIGVVKFNDEDCVRN
jgi:phosphate starvation-inducible protein PhoH